MTKTFFLPATRLLCFLVSDVFCVVINFISFKNVSFHLPFGKLTQYAYLLVYLVIDHSCDIFTQNVAAFCPFPKNLPQAKSKTVGLMVLAEDILRHPSNDYVMLLLMVTLM